ncbi:MarR family winged helix-turn-helix transcriptional regulator, partial [Bacteroidota bacterium]
DIKEFSIYLKDKVILKYSANNEKLFNKKNYKNYTQYPEVEFSALLTGLYRYAKHYTKKALGNTSIKTIDEFGFLASLIKEKSLLKHELINMHLLEISTGSEILKRLIKSDLIYEYPDSQDKRAKKVSLTEKGKNEIMKAFENMHKVSEIIIGELNDKELGEALSVFNKLNYFHKHIHENDRNTSLEKLHTKYIKGEK